jgi:hypothetical protein
VNDSGGCADVGDRQGGVELDRGCHSERVGCGYSQRR